MFDPLSRRRRAPDQGGRGRGGGTKPGTGPSGECICPQCGYRKPHVVGQPCSYKTCPKCGTMMMRE